MNSLFTNESTKKQQFLKTQTFKGSHDTNLLQKLDRDRVKAESGLCDFVLNIGNKNVKAHKIVLSLCSDYFAGMFIAKKESRIEEDLRSLDADSVLALINFIYTTSIMITRENVLNLAAAADLLQINEVKKFCKDFVDGFFSPASCTTQNYSPTQQQLLPNELVSSSHFFSTQTTDSKTMFPVDDKHDDKDLTVEIATSTCLESASNIQDLKPCSSNAISVPFPLSPSGCHSDVDESTSRSESRLQFGSFLDFNCVLDILLDPNVQFLPSIPEGLKENVYFVVENMENIMRMKVGVPRRFDDDGGPWATNKLTISYYWIKDGKTTQVSRNQKRYCVRRQGEFKLCKPMPTDDEVLKVGKQYTHHKLDSSYKRRISWVYNSLPWCKPVCVVEYMGKYPGPDSRLTIAAD